MKTLTLTDIIDYDTIGDDHLAGEARFSDDKRYRFVIDREWDHYAKPPTQKAPAVEVMFYFDAKGVWDVCSPRKPIPKRAALIMADYPEYLARAKVRKAADDAEAEAKCKAQNEAYLRDKVLKEAAGDLLAVCQALVKDAEVFGLAGETNHPAVRCRIEGLTLGHVYAINDAITKATTLPT